MTLNICFSEPQAYLEALLRDFASACCNDEYYFEVSAIVDGRIYRVEVEQYGFLERVAPLSFFEELREYLHIEDSDLRFYIGI